MVTRYLTTTGQRRRQPQPHSSKMSKSGPPSRPGTEAGYGESLNEGEGMQVPPGGADAFAAFIRGLNENQLQRLLLARGLTLSGCIEREDLVKSAFAQFGYEYKEDRHCRRSEGSLDESKKGEADTSCKGPSGGTVRPHVPLTTARLREIERLLRYGGKRGGVVQPAWEHAAGLHEETQAQGVAQEPQEVSGATQGGSEQEGMEEEGVASLGRHVDGKAPMPLGVEDQSLTVEEAERRAHDYCAQSLAFHCPYMDESSQDGSDDEGFGSDGGEGWQWGDSLDLPAGPSPITECAGETDEEGTEWQDTEDTEEAWDWINCPRAMSKGGYVGWLRGKMRQEQAGDISSGSNSLPPAPGQFEAKPTGGRSPDPSDVTAVESARSSASSRGWFWGSVAS